MDIAQSKRKENIAEYILYLWQIEEEQKHVYLLWYMDIVNLLRKEGKEESGHLEHTLHLIGDMHNLHLQLMQNPVGEHYRTTFARLAPQLPMLRTLVKKEDVCDTEICFRALYAAMLYRIKGDKKRAEAINDTIELVSPVVAELAAMYGKVERGEIDLFENM